MDKKHCNKIEDIWFLTSELEGGRASSFRQERWCRIFLDEGARLRIFNLRGAFGHSDVICETHEQLTNFRQHGVNAYSGPSTSVREGWWVRGIRRIKHLLLADLFLPNVFKMLLHVHHLLQQRTAPIVLMASSPSFSVALVGAVLKSLHGNKVVFIIDMRDAWALHTSLGGIKPLKFAIERTVFKRADHISTVSVGLADEFNTNYGVNVRVMYNVATHYLDVPPAKLVDWSLVSADIQPERHQVVYTGSTPEGFYDLKSMLSAVLLLRQRYPDLADKLQMVFIGACDEVRREATRQGLDNTDIVFVGHLPHELTRSVQASAYALLFLAYMGPKNAGVVSTKLFEYLCLGQPVLPLGLYEDSDVDILLRRYCGKSLYLHGAEAIMTALASLAREGNSSLPLLKDVNRVRELVTDYQTYAAELIRM